MASLCLPLWMTASGCWHSGWERQACTHPIHWSQSICSRKWYSLRGMPVPGTRPMLPLPGTAKPTCKEEPHPGVSKNDFRKPPALSSTARQEWHPLGPETQAAHSADAGALRAGRQARPAGSQVVPSCFLFPSLLSSSLCYPRRTFSMLACGSTRQPAVSQEARPCQAWLAGTFHLNSEGNRKQAGAPRMAPRTSVCWQGDLEKGPQGFLPEQSADLLESVSTQDGGFPKASLKRRCRPSWCSVVSPY